MSFLDRREAGRRLAAQLARFAGERPVVVALPRGGVPVAVEVARALQAPLAILAVRKLGAPQNPELAVGAVAEDGTAILDSRTAAMVGMTQATLDRTLEREVRELRRRVERYRDGRPSLDVRDRTVILVDDGVATGLTDLAAIRALRRRGARRIVVAAPVGARDAVSMLGEEADEVVCVSIPHDFRGVGRWYTDFSPVSDEEVGDLLAAMGAGPPAAGPGRTEREVAFEIDGTTLRGDLTVPVPASGLVLFAHGSGSSRLSPRNRAVARTLNDAGFATLLFDLLADHEAMRRELVFDVVLLAGRLEAVTRWALELPATEQLPIGYFGASTGAAAALRAAADVGPAVRAVVSRGGRPDLAADRLAHVQSPTLLAVGGRDPEVLRLNEQAAAMLRCPHRVVVVEGAGHLFEEPGTLEAVASLAVDWFNAHLAATQPRLHAVGA